MPGDDDEEVWCMCVVDDVLHAYFSQQGLMGLDAKRKVWRSVVGLDKLEANFYDAVTAEYDGKLAVLWYGSSKQEINVGLPKSKSVKIFPTIRSAVIALDWIGEVIRGTIEWYGVLTMPEDSSCAFQNFLVVSD
ncbi:unnamed protein product [Microthlaspi erraticum]|uniref:F-box associated domain-containing protein n=1 Tax=Microthlaspi erraticum TaxID=1685480 RepID=A0A6D2JY58_9BRAS|nr:unnamed protein product [Microthlaspi erraticum]